MIWLNQTNAEKERKTQGSKISEKIVYFDGCGKGFGLRLKSCRKRI